MARYNELTKGNVMADSNIIVATFDDESKTYQAFSDIKRAASEGKLKINGLTVMHRNLQGQYEIRDAAMKNFGGSMIGGIVGSLVGVLGGPLGVLLGWAGGSMIGGFRDARELMDDRTLFQRISENMEAGSTALLGEVIEPNEQVVAGIIRKLGGELMRRPTDAIEADIRAAEGAHQSAAQEARRVFDEMRTHRTDDSSSNDDASGRPPGSPAP